MAPVSGSIPGTSATFILSVQADHTYLQVAQQVTGAQILLLGGTRRLDGTIAGPPPASLPISGPASVAGQSFQVFSLNGAVYPSGFLPITVGNVRERALLDIYRDSARLRALRGAEFAGPCGTCPDRLLCGGSRARAYSDGDVLGSDPGCLMATFPTPGYAEPAIAAS